MTIKKDKANVSVILPKKQHEILKKIALSDKRTVSNLIGLIIDEYLRNL